METKRNRTKKTNIILDSFTYSSAFKFSLFFLIIGLYNITVNPDILGIFNIIIVGILAFFDFGYYRIFEAFLYLSPQKFLSKNEIEQVLDKKRFEFRAHMVPGILYIIITWLLLVILIIIN